MSQTDFSEHIRRATRMAEKDSNERAARGAYAGLSFAADLHKADRLSAFVATLSGLLAVDEPELSAELMDFLRRGYAASNATETGK